MTDATQDLIARLAGFTPGPWTWAGEDSFDETIWLFSGDVRVLEYAGCGSHDTEATPEDRALIAAAPDLHRELTTALAREAGLRKTLQLYSAAITEAEAIFGGEYPDQNGVFAELVMDARGVGAEE